MASEITTPAANASLPSADGGSPRPPWLIGLVALVVFALIGAGLSYYGIQDQVISSPGSTTPQNQAAGLVTSMVLPSVDMPIPDGPHRDAFRVACTVCHSTRLVFTQPLLTDKQWTAVVHKMTAKYGAPLTADEEKQMVQYLYAVHGK